MRDEDFVLGYVTGYNDGVGSGEGSGGIIIKEGTSVYDVPIIRNYSLVGTEYGLAVFDLNECAFMNIAPNAYNRPEHYKNPITGEIVTYKYPPKAISRRIGYAMTKGGQAIGICQAQTASYEPFRDGTEFVKIEDGSLYEKKDSIKSSTIANPALTWTVSPYGTTMAQLIVYMEYDIVTKTINYSQPPKTYYNEEYGFRYYLKSDLDAQVVSGETTSTIHQKIKIGTFGTHTVGDDDYPEEWLNKYRFGGLPYPIFGIGIMDNYEICTSLFDGIA